MRLADSLEEQAALELLLEASKPPLPPAVRRLHYLLATPFRYRPHLGSRFRAAFDAGVWYGAEALRTALAEKSYWRSEEHTSELQSQSNLVCRLLLQKKKHTIHYMLRPDESIL